MHSSLSYLPVILTTTAPPPKFPSHFQVFIQLLFLPCDSLGFTRADHVSMGMKVSTGVRVLTSSYVIKDNDCLSLRSPQCCPGQGWIPEPLHTHHRVWLGSVSWRLHSATVSLWVPWSFMSYLSWLSPSFHDVFWALERVIWVVQSELILTCLLICSKFIFFYWLLSIWLLSQNSFKFLMAIIITIHFYLFILNREHSRGTACHTGAILIFPALFQLLNMTGWGKQRKFCCIH